MDQQTIFEIGRIALEAVAGLSLILAGHKYEGVRKLLIVIINAVEAHDAKDVKQTVHFNALVSNTESLLAKELSELGYLGKGQNDEPKTK